MCRVSVRVGVAQRKNQSCELPGILILTILHTFLECCLAMPACSYLASLSKRTASFIKFSDLKMTCRLIRIPEERGIQRRSWFCNNVEESISKKVGEFPLFTTATQLETMYVLMWAG
jgi:hypothetical protein